jgi:hypothetical protein
MEVGQGPNWGCSAKEKKNVLDGGGYLFITSARPVSVLQIYQQKSRNVVLPMVTAVTTK